MSQPPKKKVVVKTVTKTIKKAGGKKDDAPAQELKLALYKFTPVYTFKWKGENPICSICRHYFSEKCMNCQNDPDIDSCPTQAGSCGHRFHMHCIEGWLSKNHTHCPICTREWEAVTD